MNEYVILSVSPIFSETNVMNAICKTALHFNESILYVEIPRYTSHVFRVRLVACSKKQVRILKLHLVAAYL